MYVDRPQFATHLLPLTSTGFYPDGNFLGNTLENSGKQNAKMGFKFPPSTGGNRACSKFCRLFDRFRAPKIGIAVEKESAQGSPDLVPPIDDDAVFLFRARHSIERELR